MTHEGSRAIFLSYASQDAEAARRIAESLRASGVEVWFDVEGGLEHGDEWDAKIRRQIKECVLFIPLISANTQSRHEGYFRIEWELAAQRAMGIASGVAFILPVVIDDTREPDALVPDRFRTVQWTRLPCGIVPPDVQARFLKLWSHRTGVLKHEAVSGGLTTEDRGRRTENGADQSRRQKRNPAVMAFAILALVAVAAIVVWRPWQSRNNSTTTAVLPALSSSKELSESRQLVARAWEQMNKAELARAELEVADGLCQRAIALDPNDAGAWAAASQVDAWYVYHNLDPSAARREGARTKAARALQLAPNSFEARLAHACQLVRSGGERHVSVYADEADGLLRTLLREQPDEPRTLLALGILLRNTGRLSECREVLTRMANNPAFAAVAWNEIGWALFLTANNYQAAETATDTSIGLQPYWGNLLLKFLIAQRWRGDLDLAKVTVERIPSVVRQEDVGISLVVQLYHWRREPEEMLRVLSGVSRDWLQSNAYDGPKAHWSGLAHAMAGRTEAARLQWQSALKLVEQRLANQPDPGFLLHWRARLLASLGQRDEAENALRLAREMGAVDSETLDSVAVDLILMGRHEEAISVLEQRVEQGTRFDRTYAFFRLKPDYDPLRRLPRFQALLARMEADPRFSPNAKPATASSVPTIEPKSVAVLAFTNLSDDKGNEYFSDGISEELLNVLAKVPGLTVKGRSSGFFFKGKDTPVPEIGRQLDVTYVVQGSVRKAGNRVRISAQLIRAAADEVVWSSGSLDRELQDIFAVQDEIAGLVAQQLQLKLGTTGVARVVDPEAHRLLLEARHYWHQRGEDNFDRTEALLHRALAIDPDFAPAHAAMADLWVMRAAYRVTEGAGDLSEELRSLRASAARATELDPSLVAPIAAMAYGLLIEGRMEAAQRQFEAAVALNPNDPTVRYWRALFLMQNGDFDAARREFAHARELDPKAWIIAQLSGQDALHLGRREEALALFRQANADRPDGFAPSVGYEALVLWQTGRTDEAVAAARAVRQSWPRQPRWQADAHAIWVLRQAGLTTEAAAYADSVLAGLPAQTYQRGFVLAALGRFDEALPYLERSPTLTLDAFASLVIFDPWRDDPRFTALIEKLNWTEQCAKAREAMKQAAATKS